MSKGFKVKTEDVNEKAGKTLGEALHTSLDLLLERVQQQDSQGAACILSTPEGAVIKLSIINTTGEEDCPHCTGSGVKSSTCAEEENTHVTWH